MTRIQTLYIKKRIVFEVQQMGTMTTVYYWNRDTNSWFEVQQIGTMTIDVVFSVRSCRAFEVQQIGTMTS